MIACRPRLSNARRFVTGRTVALCLAASVALAGCADPLPVTPRVDGQVPAWAQAGPVDGSFAMPDGARLPYRHWLPDGAPRAVVLALHGMNDSRDAWEIPAPAFAAAGIAVFAPDQRGFGDAPDRGRFPGANQMAADAGVMARTLRARYPRAKLILMGESMGAAVLICLAAMPDAPRVDGYVLVAPAVWSRSEMNIFMRAGLWLLAGTFPGMTNTGSIAHVTASNNHEALRRLSYDPLTIHATRFDAVRGLVDLMDDAHEDAPVMRAPALFLYGGKDELIPKRATEAVWHVLPTDARCAYYPNGYHLLLRDQDRATVIGDVLAWIDEPAFPLPSGADRAAASWLAEQG
jgi:alpha-beta hydrolase superfamily lysophospholipase